MSFTQAFMGELHARVSLSALIGERVALRRRGREWVACCPFHGENTPSFTVVEAKGFFHCFGCGANGDAIGFLRAFYGLGFVEAVEELAARVGLLPDREGRAPRAPLLPPPPRETDEGREARRARDRQRAAQDWARRRPFAGTLVETYLREARGLPLDRIPDWQALPLGLLHDLPYWHDGAVVWRGPAMVAPLVTNDRRLVGLHRTWLAANGSGKAVIVDPAGGKTLSAKKMLGDAWGAVIPLGRRGPVMLGGEGIESTLSGRCAVPGMPGVVLGSLGNLSGGGLGAGSPHPHRPPPVTLPDARPDPARPGWVPPEEVREFTWLEDNDAKDPLSAERLVERGARRFMAAGVRFRRARPPEGKDWNDVVRGT